MANNLLRWQAAPDPPEEESEWDLPPTSSVGTTHSSHRAAEDARQARQQGDTSFAAQREEDAGEQSQSRWDWGDARTWCIIAAMCLGFLAFCAFVYFLPFGRHNQNDGPSPTPSIRVY